jgi:curli biogenesis system outer membrane secretion channel CsgG
MHSSLRAPSLRRSAALSLCLLAAVLPLSAQDGAPAAASAATAPAPALKTLAVGKIKATPALLANAAANQRRNSIDRMSQALDGQLIAALQQTRKFTVLARSDADALIEENAATGRSFAFGDSDLTLVVTIDDFQDFTQTATFASLGKTATKRVIRFSTVAKLYETKTNKLVETANFQEQTLDAEEELANSTSSGGELSDSLLVALTRRMSEKVAQRVADVAFPARILAKTGKIVTINRGDGTGIAPGQLWEVFALGEELIDPDTGASLGREEVSVGRVRVQRVTARTAQAEITGEDLGIDRQAVVRRVEQ